MSDVKDSAIATPVFAAFLVHQEAEGIFYGWYMHCGWEDAERKRRGVTGHWDTQSPPSALVPTRPLTV